MKNTVNKGRNGEKVVSEYIKKQGYQIIKNNYYFGKYEVDIIASNKYYLIFVEVKTRKFSDFILPREVVNINKQNRIKITANKFINDGLDVYFEEVRFDIAFYFYDINKIKYLKGAFN